jgi:hypothetical protein
MAGGEKGVEVLLGPGDRERLEAMIGSRNSPQPTSLISSRHTKPAIGHPMTASTIGAVAYRGSHNKGAPGRGDRCRRQNHPSTRASTTKARNTAKSAAPIKKMFSHRVIGTT